MLTLCPTCKDCYLRHASWRIFTQAEKAARGLKGETDYEITHRWCEACGDSQYRAKPLETKTKTIC